MVLPPSATSAIKLTTARYYTPSGVRFRPRALRTIFDVEVEEAIVNS